MRIDRLEIENFKCFVKQTITLHPQFTLFVGDNGSGKTSVLDALAVAAGVWLRFPPDSSLASSRREIVGSEIRLDPVERGDRTQFLERYPVLVQAFGQRGETKGLTWYEQRDDFSRNPGVIDDRLLRNGIALRSIAHRYQVEAGGETQVFPIIAYYGAG
jgi:predicted ATP-binding protein involved in virulence